MVPGAQALACGEPAVWPKPRDLQERTAQPQPSGSRHMPAEPLTAGEMRILKLLPASTYPQIATTVFISRNTVKTHIRSIYQKLGVTSRLEAIETALELRLL